MVAALTAQAALSFQPTLGSGSVLEAAERLKAGEFLWAPAIAPEGPVLLVVSLTTQRAVIYRNGIPIGITTVSTGRPGYQTPTGVFTVLQRQVEHYSSLYNNAPMPWMQRLTWGGVALHAGNLPGYPASHGCIRLPPEFARQLYGVTRLGMTVVITNDARVPRVAPAEMLLGAQPGAPASAPGPSWHPERSPSGPVSIVISSTDRRLIVLRNGRVIGSAPVIIDGELDQAYAYIMRNDEAGGRTWLQIALPGQEVTDGNLARLRGRIHVEDAFRRQVEPVLRAGTTVVITRDSLQGGSTGRGLTVIEG